MKEKDGFVDYPEQQVILYVEKEDGKYGPMQTGSYISANYLEDYVFKRRNLELELRGQLAAGTISPVKYYMVLEDLSLSELSSRAGIRKARVKKHLDAGQFGCITAAELLRYSAVFNVPAANLLQVVLCLEKDAWEASLVLEDKTGKLSVTQSATANPYVVLTKIEERTR
jgi:hypothetical protein